MSSSNNEQENNEMEFICLDEVDDNALSIEQYDIDDDDDDDEEVNAHEVIETIELDNEETDNEEKQDDVLYDEYCFIHQNVKKYFEDLELKGQPESLESDIIKMPLKEAVLEDVKRFNDLRLIQLKSITFSQLMEDFYDIMCDDAILHMDITFDKLESENATLNGVARLIYYSRHAASTVFERIKSPSINVTLTCLSDPESKKYQAIDKINLSDDWPERLLFVKNLGEPDLEQCRKLFPGAEIILHKEAHNEKLKGQVLVICETVEKAEELLLKCHEEKTRVNDKLIIVQKWLRNSTFHKEYLKLGDRLFVLEQIVKNKNMIDKAGEKEWLTNRVKWFTDVIRKDNAIRFQLNLPTPSIEELKDLTFLRTYTASEGDKFVTKLLANYKQHGNEIISTKSTNAEKDDRPSYERSPFQSSWRGKYPYSPSWGQGNFRSRSGHKRPLNSREGILGAAPLPKNSRGDALPPSLLNFPDMDGNNYASQNNGDRYRSIRDRDTREYHNYDEDRRGKFEDGRSHGDRGGYDGGVHTFRDDSFHHNSSGGYGRNNDAGSRRFSSENQPLQTSREYEKPSRFSDHGAPRQELGTEDPVTKLLYLSRLIANRIGNDRI